MKSRSVKPWFTFERKLSLRSLDRVNKRKVAGLILIFSWRRVPTSNAVAISSRESSFNDIMISRQPKMVPSENVHGYAFGSIVDRRALVVLKTTAQAMVF